MSPNELYYQTAKETIFYQSDLLREFSTRAFSLINLAVATLAVGGVIVNIRADELEWTPLLMALGATALLGFALVSLACLAAIRTRSWYAFPPLDTLSQRVQGLSDNDAGAVRKLIADYCRNGAECNERVLTGNAKLLFLAVVLLVLELVSTISLVVLVFLGTQ